LFIPSPQSGQQLFNGQTAYSPSNHLDLSKTSAGVPKSRFIITSASHGFFVRAMDIN
jgi:hypothetical protein